MNDRNQKSYVIGLDGGLRQLPEYLIEELLKKGWRRVVNPKRTYYVELDQNHPSYREHIGGTEENDILKVERL